MIRKEIQSTVEGVCTIGANLRRAKKILGHGQFVHWVESECRFSLRSAENYIRASVFASERFAIVACLSPTILYLLSAKNAPPEVVSEVLARAANGGLFLRRGDPVAPPHAGLFFEGDRPAASGARLRSRQFPAHAGDTGADRGLVTDESEGQADQDRREGREPWPLHRLPDGCGRNPSTHVPGERLIAEPRPKPPPAPARGRKWSCVHGHLTAEVHPDSTQNQTLRRRQRQVGPGFGLGLQATGHRHEPPFREARKIATMRLEFGVRLGNPGSNSLRWWLI